MLIEKQVGNKIRRKKGGSKIEVISLSFLLFLLSIIEVKSEEEE